MYRSPKIGTTLRGRSGLASGYYFGRPAFFLDALPVLIFLKTPPVYPYTIIPRWTPVSHITWLS